jgi:hypothetical protein
VTVTEAGNSTFKALTRDCHDHDAQEDECPLLEPHTLPTSRCGSTICQGDAKSPLGNSGSEESGGLDDPLVLRAFYRPCFFPRVHCPPCARNGSRGEREDSPKVR